MSLSYTKSPLQTFTSMEQIKQVLRDTSDLFMVVVVLPDCQLSEKQIIELRKYLHYHPNTRIYKIQVDEFNSNLPEDYRIQRVPVVFKGQSAFGLRVGRNDIMSVDELQQFMKV